MIHTDELSQILDTPVEYVSREARLMAGKLTISPNERQAVNNARWELERLHSVLEAAKRCIAQMDAQDTTVHFSHAVALKHALTDYDNGRYWADLRQLDAILNL
jgi:hypothetical protein